MKQKTKLRLTKTEFLSLMLGMTHRHFASLTSETIIDKSQMKGGAATAAEFGGYVTKNSRITWHHSIDYKKAVDAKLVQFDLNPEAFIASEHLYARRELFGGKLTSMSYHKDDAMLDIANRRWYLVTYVMQGGVVSSEYTYTDAFGNIVDASYLHTKLYDKRSKKQMDAGLVDITQQVIYRNYRIESLRTVHTEGMEITLV